MDFRNIYAQGFARVAASTLPIELADPATNATATIEQVQSLDAAGAAVALFPELGLSGYAIDDLLMQDTLLGETEEAILAIAKASSDLAPLIVVGAPIRGTNRIYNCAVVIQAGRILGVVPKTYLPTYREFYEQRWFASGADQAGETLRRPHWPGADTHGDVPFGPDLIFECSTVPDLKVHIEICEDMWVPVPPSHLAALSGATVLLNLSASPITVGRSQDRHVLARSASARCNAAYLYAAASEGESSTDLAWDGMTMVYECGDLLAESERFPQGRAASVVDIDLDRLRQERIRQGTFDDTGHYARMKSDPREWRVITWDFGPPSGDLGLRRQVDRFPFVPDDPDRLAQDCYEAYNIQVSALVQRLRAITTDAWQPKVVIGVSGGLDSTHALIVAAKAMDRLRRPRSEILAFTMPGFATSEDTKRNAVALMDALDVTWEELDIRSAATQMLRDLGHPFGSGEQIYDVTFENVQAGLRTDYLFRAANQRGAIVLGTGDLSELALGWCTYGVGDQMSHYGINAGVPKTLIQHLIRWVMTSGKFEARVDDVLEEILGQEISPELVPASAGQKIQSTQDVIGPYALQDFTLYHVVRRGYRPSKIAFLAEHAWSDATRGHWPPGYPESERTAYDLPTIRSWLEVFVTRFFANQFKRSALPNGPKVVAGGTMSPRGDWRMPSDASAAAWLADIERRVPSSVDS